MSELAILLTLILSLSMAMHHLVEQKFRFISKPAWFVLASVVVVALSPTLRSAQLEMYTDQEQYAFKASQDRSQYRCGKLFRLIKPGAVTCKLTNIRKTRSKVLLIGNSHADAIKSAFSEVAEKNGVDVYFQVPNNQLIKGGYSAGSIIREAKALDINSIVLHFSSKGTYMEEVRTLIDMAEAENIRVQFVMPVPIWDRNIPLAIYNNLNYQQSMPRQTKADYMKIHDQLFEAIYDIGNKNFKVYEVVDKLCFEECRYQLQSGELLYFDDNHLTLTGSRQLKDIFNVIIYDVLHI